MPTSRKSMMSPKGDGYSLPPTKGKTFSKKGPKKKTKKKKTLSSSNSTATLTVTSKSPKKKLSSSASMKQLGKGKKKKSKKGKALPTIKSPKGGYASPKTNNYQDYAIPALQMKPQPAPKPQSTFGYGERDFSLVTLKGGGKFSYHGSSPDRVKKARTAWGEGGLAKYSKRSRFDIYGQEVNTQRPRYAKPMNFTAQNLAEKLQNSQAAQPSGLLKKLEIPQLPTEQAKGGKRGGKRKGKGKKSRKGEGKQAEGKRQKEHYTEEELLALQAQAEGKKKKKGGQSEELSPEQIKAVKLYKSGVKFENGNAKKKVAIDIGKAIKYYKKSAQLQHGPAMYALGRLHADGVGVGQDFGKALDYFQDAATEGDLDAMASLGMMYANGLGLKQNYKKSFDWFKQAATLGLTRAQYNLAVIYRDGRGVKTNAKVAFKWFKKASAGGDTAAMSALGYAYCNGEGVTKNEQKGLHWFQESAEKGHPAAQYNLGIAYRDELMGCKRNLREAVGWLTAAAEQGHINAQCSLGVAYADGQGVPQDYDAALMWYTRAAEQGYVNAQYNLAVMYENGQGVPRDFIHAYAWYRQAADQGLANAQYHIAVMYENGRGVDADFKEALRWYTTAAEQGYKPAETVLQRIANGDSSGQVFAVEGDVDREETAADADILTLSSESVVPTETSTPLELSEWARKADKLRMVLHGGDAELENLFELCDLDSVNQLTPDEAAAGIVQYTQSDASLSGLITHGYMFTKEQNQEGESESALQPYEFKLFLENCLRMFEYADVFDTVDQSDDARISAKEFELIAPAIGLDPEQAYDVFNQIDTNEGGALSFDEFVTWALASQLQVSQYVQSNVTLDEDGSLETKATAEHDLTGSFFELAVNLPSAENDVDEQRRDAMFISIDTEANHFLSFNELFTVLGPLCELPKSSKWFSKNYNSAVLIKRAYDRVAAASPTTADQDQDFPGVSRSEFVFFLVYLAEYLKYMHWFTQIDADANGKISLDEFRLMFPKLRKLDASLESMAAADVFGVIDTSDNGVITFDEYVDWNAKLKWDQIHSNKQAKFEAKTAHAGYKSELHGLLTSALEKLPVELTPEDRQKRRELFSRFDPNGNGILSLAEIDKGVRDVIRANELFNAKPAIMRAFQAARKIDPHLKGSKKDESKQKKQSQKASADAFTDSFVERTEFRLLLVYLKMYFEFFVLFDRMDGDDKRIDMGEFTEHAWPVLLRLGVVTDDEYPDNVFAEIDKNSGGFILFDEFTTYALSKHVDASAAAGAADASQNGEHFEYDHPEEEEFQLNLLMAKLPLSRIVKADLEARDVLYKSLQVSGGDANTLSLQEAYDGLDAYFRRPKHFDMKKVIFKAYSVARDADSKNPEEHVTITDDDDLSALFVSEGEFRVFLGFIQMYYQLLKIFNKVDDNNSGSLSLSEFTQCVPEFRERGVTIKNAKKTFSSIAGKGKKSINFDKFSVWAFSHQLDVDDRAKTPVVVEETDADAWFDVAQVLPVSAEKSVIKARGELFTQWLAQLNATAAPAPAADKKTKGKKKGKKAAKKTPVAATATGFADAAAITPQVLAHLGIKKPAEDAGDHVGELLFTGITLIAKSAFDFAIAEARKASKAKASAKKKSKKKPAAVDDSSVTKTNFKLFLQKLADLCEVLRMFMVVDDNASGQISKDEFVNIVPDLTLMGFYIPSAATLFARIDESQGGTISFDELLTWAVSCGFKIDSETLKQSRKFPLVKVDWKDIGEAGTFDGEQTQLGMFDRLWKRYLGSGQGVDKDRPVPALSDEDVYMGLNQLYLNPSEDLDLETIIVESFKAGQTLIAAEEKKRKELELKAAAIARHKAAEEAKKAAAADSGELKTKAKKKKAAAAAEAEETVADNPEGLVSRRYFPLLVEQLKLYFGYQNIFFQMDENKSGQVSAEEFESKFELLKTLSGSLLKDKPVDKIFEEADTGEDGTLSFADFCAFVLNLRVKDLQRQFVAKQLVSIKSRLPIRTNDTDRDRRRTLFVGMDVNNNRHLNCAEVQKGLMDHLQLPETVPLSSTKSTDIIKQAFDAVKNLKMLQKVKDVELDAKDGEEDETALDDALNVDNVERREFQALLIYVANYFQYFPIFDTMDCSDDGKIDFSEFNRHYARFRKAAGDDESQTARGLFSEIDTNDGGVITFDEFIIWALKIRVKSIDSAFEYLHPDDAAWDVKITKLPVQQNNVDQAKREKLFFQFDIANNKVLSSAEIAKGLKNFLNIVDKTAAEKEAEAAALTEGEEVKKKTFTSGDIQDILDQAFLAAKKASKERDVAVFRKEREAADAKLLEEGQEVPEDRPKTPENPNNLPEDVIVEQEFRLLLLYVKEHFEYLQLFKQMDTENTGVISFAEFEEALPVLSSHGIDIPADQLNDTFNKIDEGQEGFLKFEEFFSWLMARQLELELEKERLLKAAKGHWSDLVQLLPSSKSKQDYKHRKKLFRKLDTAGNGVLSLEEASVGIKEVLNCEELMDVEPVIQAAFDRAKLSGGNPETNDVVTKAEFRLLLLYLQDYFVFFQIFNRIDNSSDMKINWGEFNAAVPSLIEHGLKGLDNPWDAFCAIDENEGGVITFDEFFSWIMKINIESELAEVEYIDGEGYPYYYVDNDESNKTYYYDEDGETKVFFELEDVPEGDDEEVVDEEE